MARKRKGDKIDGWLIVDKGLGYSSSKAVAIAKRILGAQKAGHAGTLDPLASGILPIGFGEATKTMPFVVDSTKEYSFTVCWGTATDSDDAEGDIIHSGGSVPTKDQVEGMLARFTGDIEQTPPIYSAIKIDGERAYKLAREGIVPEMKKRNVQIHKLSLISHDADKGNSCFEVTCGKGTYVRSIGRDIALALGTYGHIIELRRLRVGPFDLSRAISLEKLEELGHSARALEELLPITTALDDIPALAVTEDEAKAIKFGRSLTLTKAKQGTLVLLAGGLPLAIAEANPDGDGNMTVKPLRVFNIG
ncbi:MAG: tRNA pseudouridine(55) synthase TruB [Kordiimonadales bacterium]|nr:MAG: tRNA pseudouridine(55) synthase TruB [Kordiimonadales bacterium]